MIERHYWIGVASQDRTSTRVRLALARMAGPAVYLEPEPGRAAADRSMVWPIARQMPDFDDGFNVSEKYCTGIIKMLSRTAAALAALLVFGQSALAASNNRSSHHGRAVRHAPPPAAFARPAATTSPPVKPFTAEEKGWFDRASRVF